METSNPNGQGWCAPKNAPKCANCRHKQLGKEEVKSMGETRLKVTIACGFGKFETQKHAWCNFYERGATCA